MTDHAVSVRARLLNLARQEGEDFQRLLIRFAIERLLFRLSRSEHAEEFVLKGATLFAQWLGKPHRATKDLDLLGRGGPDIERLVRVFQDVAVIACPEDGVVFGADAVVGRAIREDAQYQGVRVVVPGHLAGARFKVQVDVGVGDALVPPPEGIELDVLLPLPAPRLKAYAKETVVAEKLEALVVLGLATSRMKDIYDLDLLRGRFDFDQDLVEAIRATFARRGTPLPVELPIGLSDAFASDEGKRTQWRAFLRKSGGESASGLDEVVRDLREWLWPLLKGAADAKEAKE